MANRLLDRLIPKKNMGLRSYLRNLVTGSLYRMDSVFSDTSLANIKTQIDTMRALARDSQVSTALSYYATDATTVNTKGQIMWATSNGVSKRGKEAADIINGLIKVWDINDYARDHILELATIGNLYRPTSMMYSTLSNENTNKLVMLDNNTIPISNFKIDASHKIPPENIVHLWKHGEPFGYIYQPDDDDNDYIMCPEDAIIHFSLGGLLGDYTIDLENKTTGEKETYDIQFAQPMMEQAVQPTQTLSLLEDSILLSSLIRVVRFINVDCGDIDTDEEARDSLQQIKDAIEQQLSINTITGDTQSFVNPQSPNNLIYLPKINGADAISVTELNMAQSTEADNDLLNYYQDKKLSVLGVPKEMMNFSSNEGLGGAGSVLSQRSAIYANGLMRLETAYMSGWRHAFNTYLRVRGYSDFVDAFDLHMNPIVTNQSTLTFDKRDAALSQAQNLVTLLQTLNVDGSSKYKSALTEILSEVFPQTGADVENWDVKIQTEGAEEGSGMF